MPIDIDKYYAGISHAETGSEKNPYIRTKVKDAPGGSTAFGPVQITGKLAESANKAGYLKDSKDFYEKEMKPRYEKMAQSGKNKGKPGYSPRHDYGGDAEFDTKKHGQDYVVFAKEIMTGVAKEAKEDEKTFVKKWRGKDEKQDPEYFKKVEEGKNKFDADHPYDRELAKKMVDGLG